MHLHLTMCVSVAVYTTHEPHIIVACSLIIEIRFRHRLDNICIQHEQYSVVLLACLEKQSRDTKRGALPENVLWKHISQSIADDHSVCFELNVPTIILYASVNSWYIYPTATLFNFVHHNIVVQGSPATEVREKRGKTIVSYCGFRCSNNRYYFVWIFPIVWPSYDRS